MQILTFRAGNIRNYGDELNLWLWPQIVPELDNSSGTFVGIGTHIDHKLPRPCTIFGAGAGYGPAPDLSDCKVYFVRGPRTAKVCGLGDAWITDPAILLASLVPYESPRYPVSFMPRWSTHLDADFEDKLRDVGIRYINPTADVGVVNREIMRTELLITEALHGAIAADSFRRPWIPCYSEQGHVFKWLDWCGSLGIPWNPADLHVCGVDWIAKSWRPTLSKAAVFQTAMDRTLAQVDRLRDDLR